MPSNDVTVSSRSRRGLPLIPPRGLPRIIGGHPRHGPSASRGQSVSEYAVVFSVVAAAIIGMQLYLKRGLQAKEKSATDYLTNVGGASHKPFSAQAAIIGKTAQYEPYYTANGAYTTNTDNTQKEIMSANGLVARTGIHDTTTRNGSATQGGLGSLGVDDTWEATGNGR